MKNLFKNVKQLISIASTILIIIVLFGIIFVKLDLAEPGPTFFLELAAICVLVITIKFNWYNWAEDKRSKEEDIKEAERTYDENVDKEITDIPDFEKFLVILNKENREHYVQNKLKNRTPKNCPKYNQLKEKYERLALKRVKEIKSCDVKTRGKVINLVDAKNYQHQKKVNYQIVSTVVSISMSILLACISFKELMMSWENAFRYVSYLCTICTTMWTTIQTAFKNTEEEKFDHLTRLQFIVDKYKNYKEDKKNGSVKSKS